MITTKSNIPGLFYRATIPFVFVALIAILAAYISLALTIPFVSPDTGYYLKIAYDLAEGMTYYRHMNEAYTPLGMIMLAQVYKLFPDASIQLMFAFLFTLIFIDAYLFCQLLKRLKLNRNLRFLFTLFFLVTVFILEGTNVLLEPFVLLFQFPALLILLRWKESPRPILLVLTGFLTFVVFMTKQYGLFMVPAFIYFILTQGKDKSRRIPGLFIYFTGAAFLLLLLFVYFHFAYNIGFWEAINRLLGIQYISGEEIITGINYSFVRFLESLLNFSGKATYLWLAVFLIVLKGRRIISGMSLFYLLLILGGSLQLIFAGYYHYYQLIIPYILLFIVQVLQQHFNAAKAMQYIKLTGIVFVLSSLVWLMVDYNLMTNRNRAQTADTEIIQKYLQENDKVYLEGISTAFYIICKFDTPDYKKLGYKFPSELSHQRIDEGMSPGSYLVARPEILETSYFTTGYQKINSITLFDGKEYLILQKQ